MSDFWTYALLLGMGAYHGINPAMGWLFAVALGLQERKRRAVFAALLPIALGHMISVAVVLLLLWLAQSSLPMHALRIGLAAVLFGFGLYRFIRFRHPAWVGMRVGFRDLTLWSFIMASAHGAGLMLVPLLFGWSEAVQANHSAHMQSAGLEMHAQHFPAPHLQPLANLLGWIGALGIHTTGHLLVSALIAFLVYEKLGLALLRRAWFNLDLLWVIALMLSGFLLLIL
jgi:hypothetical protein